MYLSAICRVFHPPIAWMVAASNPACAALVAAVLGHAWVQAVLLRADESDHAREVCELIASGANVAITFPIAQRQGAVEVHATRPDGTRKLIASESFELSVE